MTDTLRPIGDNLYVFTDTCNVYILREGNTALLIDFGEGRVLDVLPEIGVGSIEWVLFTHHHREQCQGAARLAACGAKLAAPKAERDFFENPLQYRKAQPRLDDPFTCCGSSYLRPPANSIRIDHAFDALDDFQWHSHEIWAVGTPGNSPGSMTYMLHGEEGWIAFSGDVMLDGARMHTWFDSEWDYGYAAGIYALYASAFTIERFQPARLFPSHGPPVNDPDKQLPVYRQKLKTLSHMYLRGWDEAFSVDDADHLSRPSPIPHVWQVTPHLYKFGGAGFGGNFHMILSDSGHALCIDCGGWNREWLDRRIEQMREHLGLRHIDAVIVSHMHCDHVLDGTYLKRKYGTQIWTLKNISETLENPERFDYTCPLTPWAGHDAVKVDRTFTPGEALEWHGLHLTFDWLPGQTEFGMIVYGEIDGHLVAFTGDNLFGSRRDTGHDAVVARNSGIFEEGYIYCAEFLSRLQPDLILGGHSIVIDRPGPQLARFQAWAYQIREAFRALSPEEEYQYFFDPFWVRAYPYRVTIAPGQTANFRVIVRNHRDRPERHSIKLRLPEGWTATPQNLSATVAPKARYEHSVCISAPSSAAPGVCLGLFDITLDGRRYCELFDFILVVIPR